MLEWIAVRPRDYAEVMESWRTSCPRLSIWEDACLDGLIDYEPGTGKVILSEAGKAFLLESRTSSDAKDAESHRSRSLTSRR